MRSRGFSIIEIVIAMGILAVVLVGVVGGFISNLQTNSRTEVRGVAVTLAQQKLEALRRLDLTARAAGQQEIETVTASDGRRFQLTTRYCVDSSRCMGSARQVVVQVARLGSNGQVEAPLYTVETVYTRLNDQLGTRP